MCTKDDMHGTAADACHAMEQHCGPPVLNNPVCLWSVLATRRLCSLLQPQFDRGSKQPWCRLHRCLNNSAAQFSATQHLIILCWPFVLRRYTLIMVLSGLLMGCMTYKQATLASVLAWPYTVRMPYLARDIHAMRQEELAEQQRRGLGPAQ